MSAGKANIFKPISVQTMWYVWLELSNCLSLFALKVKGVVFLILSRVIGKSFCPKLPLNVNNASEMFIDQSRDVVKYD